MAKKTHPLDETLLMALSHPLGIYLTCAEGDRDALVMALNSRRGQSTDPLIRSLQIRISPTSPYTEVWVVVPRLAEPEGEAAS